MNKNIPQEVRESITKRIPELLKELINITAKKEEE